MSNRPNGEALQERAEQGNDEPAANDTISIGQAISFASLLEASAPKPGNVHRGADFSNTTFYDFMVSAVVIGNRFESAESLTIGQLIYDSVAATKKYVGTNTNLGMILLFAPLAKTVFTGDSKNDSNEINNVLSKLDRSDCQKVFAAIALANAGGMGEVEALDVNSFSFDSESTPNLSDASKQNVLQSKTSSDKTLQNEKNLEDDAADLLTAMNLAKDRDTIALQYCNGFAEVRHLVAPTLLQVLESGESLPDAIVYTHIKTMANIPDTLIARKCGREMAVQASSMAKQVLTCFESDRKQYNAGLADLDFWLRSDGNRRNPGTTADLVAAGLFLLIRMNLLSPTVIHQGLDAAREKRGSGTN